MSKIGKLARKQKKFKDRAKDWLDDFIASKGGKQKAKEAVARIAKKSKGSTSYVRKDGVTVYPRQTSIWDDGDSDDFESEKDSWVYRSPSSGKSTGSYGDSSSSYGGSSYSRGYDKSYGYSGSYGGYGYGGRPSSYTGYGGIYSGGSSSLFGSYSYNSVSESKEMLDIKSFVSNLVSIHDPGVTKKVTLSIRDNNMHIGNVFTSDSMLVPLLPEVIAGKKSFNDKLDILSGQALMTSELQQSDNKTEIRDSDILKNIEKYCKKQSANTDVLLKALKFIASMLSENVIEKHILDSSPGYSNYIESFRSFYYKDRVIAGIKEHQILSPIDIAYVKYRSPESISEVLDAAKEHLHSDQYELAKKADSALDKVANSKTPITKDTIFNMSLQIMMVIISALSSNEELLEKLNKTGDLSSLGISQGNIDSMERSSGFLMANDTLMDTMNQRSMTEAEESAIGAIEKLESYDYKSYKMDVPGEVGLVNFKQFEINTYTMKGRQSSYETLRQGTEPYIAPLRRMMAFRDFEKKTTVLGQKRGKLDRSKLSIVNHTDRIYKKTMIDKSSNVSVCLVIDESGSMSGAGIKGAKALACLFAEAFMGSKTVDLHIYGHTAQEGGYSRRSENLQSVVIRKYPTKHSITDVTSRSNNMDGVAMYAIGEEFLKVAKGENKIMIVLSDGNPNAQGYTGSEAVRHTKECVDMIEKKLNIIPMQVAIASHVDSNLMFKRWFQFDDMTSFIPNMSQLIKKVLKEF